MAAPPLRAIAASAHVLDLWVRSEYLITSLAAPQALFDFDKRALPVHLSVYGHACTG